MPGSARIPTLVLAAVGLLGMGSGHARDCTPEPIAVTAASDQKLIVQPEPVRTETLSECPGDTPTRVSPSQSAALWRLSLSFPSASPQTFVVEPQVSGYELICLHWPLKSGGYERQCAGESIPPGQWPLKHPRPIFPIPDLVDLDRAIYLETVHNTRPEAALLVEPMAAIVNRSLDANLLSGMFYGVLAVVAVACMAASVALGEAAFLWYGLHLAALGLALFGFSGLGTLHTWSVFGDRGFEAALALLSLGFAFAGQFLREFLGGGQATRAWDRGLLTVTLAATVAAPLAILKPGWIEPLIAVIALALIGMMTGGSLRRARDGFRPARWLLIGAFAFGLGVVAVALDILDILRWPGRSGATIFRVGVLIAAFCMLGGLIVRTRAIRQQRDQAMANALAQSRIALHRVNIDEVTGLASRNRLQSAGTEAMSTVLEQGGTLAMLTLDLDRFSALEKTQPHPVVDRVLRMLANRLEEIVADEGMLARPATDVFCLLWRSPRPDDGEPVKHLAERMRVAIATPLSIGEQELRPTATIGVAVAPETASSFEALQVASNRAVIEGKIQGGNVVTFYQPGRHDVSARRTATQTEVFNAIKEGQLSLHYQPMVAVESGRLLGYEALVRWFHPKRGQIRPDEFLPQIEGTHLMVELGRAVQQLACEELVNWKDTGVTRLRISINVSAVELQQPDFLDGLLARLDEHGVDPRRIELELTESSLVQNLQHAAGVLEACAREGIDTLVDDFGTGYSSLAYVRNLPLAGLKVDRSFTRRLEESEEDRAIVDTIIQLAHNLGLRVVAEGVETQGQRRFLKRARCDVLQGFLIGGAEPLAHGPPKQEPAP